MASAVPIPTPAGNGPPNLTLVPNTGSDIPPSNSNGENSSSSWIKPVLSKIGAVLMLIQFEGGSPAGYLDAEIRANLSEDERDDDRQLFLFRVGGGAPKNLKLNNRGERTLDPPGFSLLAGFDAKEVAAKWRILQANNPKAAAMANVMGQISIRSAFKHGFRPMATPSSRQPNHVRLTHKLGEAGFDNLELRQRLSSEFTNVSGL